MSIPDFLKWNNNEDPVVQLSNKNLSNETLSYRIGQLESYLAEGSQIKFDLDLRNNPLVTDRPDSEIDGFGRLVIFLKNFGSCVKRLLIGGTGISGAGLCQFVEFIKMGVAEELDFSNLLNVEQADVVALFSAVKECQQYPLNKSLPLQLRLDKNGLANPEHLVAMQGNDLCCEVLMESSEYDKAQLARSKAKVGEAPETDVMISLPYFYLQEPDEAVTTPTPKTPPLPPSTTPEKKALNLKAKAPAPPPPPPLMEEVKVEEEDHDSLNGSVPKAFRGSSAKKAPRVVAPKRPSHEPPVDLLWAQMSSSAKAMHRVEDEIKKSTSAKAVSRCDPLSPEMAPHAVENVNVPIIGFMPPPNQRPRPSRSVSLAATPLPPPLPPPPRKKAMPCAPPKSGLPPKWPAKASSDQQDWTRPLTAFSGPAEPSSDEYVIGMPPNGKDARTPLLDTLLKAGVEGRRISEAASNESLRIAKKVMGFASAADGMASSLELTPATYPTSSQVRTVPSPQQKQAGSHGTKALAIEDWRPDEEKSWNGWEDWNGEWYKRDQASERQKWGDVKKEAPWSRYQKAKEDWPLDDQEEKEDWNKEWQEGKNEWKEQKAPWKEWEDWQGEWIEDMKEVKPEREEEWKGGWKDWSEWKGNWNNWDKQATWKWEEVKEDKEWKTVGWEKDSEAWNGSQWSWSSKSEETTSLSAKDVEEKPKAVEESSTRADEDEETEEIEEEEEEQDKIGHWAKLLQRLQKMEEAESMELSEKDKWKELHQTEEEFRDKSTSEDGDVSDGDSVFVPNPRSVYMTSAAVDDAMDVEDVIKKSRETIQRALGEANPRKPGKRSRSPLPQEPSYPPPKKGRHARRPPGSGSKRRSRHHELDDNRKNSTVGLQELLFSQKSCKDKFQCGRSVDQLVKDLESGKVDLSAPFLRLTVFETRDEKTRKTELRCIDNRRLLALKEYAKKIGKPNLRVNVSFFSEDTLTQVKRFMQNSDDTDGSDVRLRRSRNDKRKSHSPK